MFVAGGRGDVGWSGLFLGDLLGSPQVPRQLFLDKKQSGTENLIKTTTCHFYMLFFLLVKQLGYDTLISEL